MALLVYALGISFILSTLLIPAVTFFLLRSTVTQVKAPDLKREEKKEDYSELKRRLSALQSIPTPVVRRETGVSPSRTRPDFKLRGVLISESYRGVFIERGGKLEFIRPGESVGGFVLREVLPDGAVFEGKGGSFLVSMEVKKTGELSPATHRKTPPGEVVISRREIERITRDPARMFTQIRLVPYVRGGETKGFIFEWVKPGSIFERLGIRRGDILVSINNMSIRSGEDAFRILQILRNEPSLKIVLIRRGKKEEINVRIE